MARTVTMGADDGDSDADAAATMPRLYSTVEEVEADLRALGRGGERPSPSRSLELEGGGLDDNIHNDPDDGAGGIRVPSNVIGGDGGSAASRRTSYESLRGEEALGMHGRHLIRVPTVRPLLEDDWFVREIEEARRRVLEESGGDWKVND